MGLLLEAPGRLSPGRGLIEDGCAVRMGRWAESGPPPYFAGRYQLPNPYLW